MNLRPYNPVLQAVYVMWYVSLYHFKSYRSHPAELPPLRDGVEIDRPDGEEEVQVCFVWCTHQVDCVLCSVPVCVGGGAG